MADGLKYWSDGLPVEIFENGVGGLKYWEDGLPSVLFAISITSSSHSIQIIRNLGMKTIISNGKTIIN